MCGLAGVVRFDRPGAASLADARAIRDRLRHRGPDGLGEVATAHAALAHARLAMLDRAGGAQPMTDERYALIYNGELYDHAALRARIAATSGARAWHGASDTETVLAAWRAWGPACVARLDGMFAFAIWDAEEGALYAARDRLGVKPLAYAPFAGGGVALASEAHALFALAELGPPRADPDAIVEYLIAPMFSGVARAPFAGVAYLPPAHVLRVARDGTSLTRYWRWTPGHGAPPEPAALRAALADAVADASRADVPIGVFLSGGLDSTAIAALAPPEVAPAFAITFAGAARWAADGASRVVISDDAPFARLAARALGRPLVEVPHAVADLAAELAALARVDDALPAWEQELSQRTLARAAAAHGVKGVLVGDGADELFHGYHFALDAGSFAALWTRLGDVPVARGIAADPHARLEREYRALATGPDDPPLARAIVERWLPRLLWNGDVHAMAFGLEARVPFAAARVIALAMAAAPAPTTDKAALRAALAGVVPEPIRTRVKSALPKPQDVAAVYRAEAARVVAAPHPVVATYVDLAALAPAIHGHGPLAEPDRARLFRTIALHHWALAHGVHA